MERSVMDITLELQSSYSHAQATVKRGDTHRSLRIHLADGGRPYPVDGNCTAIFTAVKPDGSHLYNACRVEDAVLYDLTPQTTALPGQLECELRIYGEDGALLTSAAFVLTVADTVYADGDENIASTGEVSALTKLVSEATEKLAQMDAVLENEVNHATIDDTTVGADTWSSKNIVDKLCPSFTESGSMVVCQPLEGYPLEVTTAIEAAGPLALSHCGKNLFDFKQNVAEVNLTNSGGGITTRYGHAIRLPAGTYTLHVENAQSATRFIYGAINGADGSYKSAFNLVIETSIKKQTVTIDDGDVLYLYNGVIGSSVAGTTSIFGQFDIQIEVGSVATAFEPYCGQTYTAEPLEAGTYSWPAIAALPGTNYLYSDSGNTTVTGRKDIITLLQNM